MLHKVVGDKVQAGTWSLEETFDTWGPSACPCPLSSVSAWSVTLYERFFKVGHLLLCRFQLRKCERLVWNLLDIDSTKIKYRKEALLFLGLKFSPHLRTSLTWSLWKMVLQTQINSICKVLMTELQYKMWHWKTRMSLVYRNVNTFNYLYDMTFVCFCHRLDML